MKKSTIAKIIITSVFTISFFLSMVPIYPFGEYDDFGGDVVLSRPLPLVSIPIYPLTLLSNFLETLSLPTGKIEGIYILIGAIVLLSYYYLLSLILVTLYIKIKKKIKLV